jgi:hypothetical protein
VSGRKRRGREGGEDALETCAADAKSSRRVLCFSFHRLRLQCLNKLVLIRRRSATDVDVDLRGRNAVSNTSRRSREDRTHGISLHRFERLLPNHLLRSWRVRESVDDDIDGREELGGRLRVGGREVLCRESTGRIASVGEEEAADGGGLARASEGVDLGTGGVEEASGFATCRQQA